MTVGSATQDASYMTYTLATTVDDCLSACDQIEGCVFVVGVDPRSTLVFSLIPLTEQG